jgi:hypothetical protein
LAFVGVQNCQWHTLKNRKNPCFTGSAFFVSSSALPQPAPLASDSASFIVLAFFLVAAVAFYVTDRYYCNNATENH